MPRKHRRDRPVRYLQRRRKGYMLTPSAVLRESDIDKAVQEAVKELTPDVQWIRHEIALDWSGDRAIYFRVMLSNDASREARLAKVTKRVESFLSKKLNLDESDLLSYFRYRSRSEQAVLKEPAWSKR
jgi:hypothetical protein